MTNSISGAKPFYEEQYRQDGYSGAADLRVVELLKEFVRTYGLETKSVLEVGCGRGWYQNLVANWTGVDLAESAGAGIHKPFFCAPAEKLPFPDSSFDAAWTIHVLEHVSPLEAALEELARVVRPGGVVLIKPAWFCRSWAASGVMVRPWRDLTRREKLTKASVPVRDSVWFRTPPVLARRLLREGARLFSGGAPTRLRHQHLAPNFEVFWQADSDACNSIDPHEVVLWFRSRGWEAPGHDAFVRRLFVRGGGLVFRKPEGATA